MWPFKKTESAQHTEDCAAPIHPLALRIYEIEQSIESGFWAYNGGRVAGAFSVVARMLAEQEAKIRELEKAQDA